MSDKKEEEKYQPKYFQVDPRAVEEVRKRRREWKEAQAQRAKLTKKDLH